MKKNYVLFALVITLCFALQNTNAQQNVFSRSDAGTGDFGSANNPWYYEASNNIQGDPDNGNSVANYIKIGHNNNKTMKTNGRFYQFSSLDFQAGATEARTIDNFDGGGLSAFGGIYNASSATHIINTPLGIDGTTVQLHVNSTGGLTFNDNIFINAHTVEFGGTGSGSIITTGTMSGEGGNVTKTGDGTLTISSLNTYTGTTTVSAGTLVLNSDLLSSDVTVQSGATLQISGNVTIKSLTVVDGGIVTIDSGKSLIVNGTSSGKVTYNRELPNAVNGNNWYLVSSPVSDENMTTMRANNNFAQGTNSHIGFATYNPGDDTWSYFSSESSESLVPGTGYSAKLSSPGDNISFTGELNTSDVETSSLSEGFNLIGNPFTSFINSATFLEADTSSNIDQSQIWLWSQKILDYETKVLGDLWLLPPTQGFFVKATSAGKVTFSKSNQENTGNGFQKSSRTELKLWVNDGELNRYSKIYYTDAATKDFDYGWEGEVFGAVVNGIETPLTIYSDLIQSNGKKYQIQSLPNKDYETLVVPIGIVAGAGKQLTFTAEAMNLPAGLKVFLEDRANNTFNRLDEANSTYTITLDESLNDIGRFYLHTTASALSTNKIDLENVSVYTTNASNLRVVGINQENVNVTLFNMLGKQVFSKDFESNGVSDLNISSLTKGFYIVQVNSEKGTLNKKIILE